MLERSFKMREVSANVLESAFVIIPVLVFIGFAPQLSQEAGKSQPNEPPAQKVQRSSHDENATIVSSIELC